MITHIEIGKEIKTDIPKEGFYVKLKWMYGDADGYAFKEIGPFPEERKDLYIEFLNVLNAMIAEYAKTGKGGFDAYDHIPGVEKFFCTDEFFPDELHLDEDSYNFLYDLDLRIETVPNGYENEAELLSFTPYYHDGENINPYNLVLEEE